LHDVRLRAGDRGRRDGARFPSHGAARMRWRPRRRTAPGQPVRHGPEICGRDVARRGDRGARGALSRTGSPGSRGGARAMTDSLGWRRKVAVVAPSSSTSVQPEFDDMRPRGVTNYFSRVWIPDDPVESDEDFNRLMENI